MIKGLLNWLIERRIEKACRLKWEAIARHNPVGPPALSILVQYRSLWQVGNSRTETRYLTGYAAISGVKDGRYVPESIYYKKIEPILNNRVFALAYSDKNFYERYLPAQSDLFPKVKVRAINGILLDKDYQRLTEAKLSELFTEGEDYILKPSVDTSGGAGVCTVKFIGGIETTSAEKLNTADFLSWQAKRMPGFVIQERIRQHTWFSDFNPSSLNTVRIFTYRSVKDDKVHVLSSVLRFGRSGSLVDNQAAGGFTCGISKNGMLNDFSCTKTGRVSPVPEVVRNKAGQVVPCFETMAVHSQDIAPVYGYHRLLGFDWCVDDSGAVRLLEINCRNIEINFLQMNNGPLFGDLSEEVAAYCRSHKKIVAIDFEI